MIDNIVSWLNKNSGWLNQISRMHFIIMLHYFMPFLYLVQLSLQGKTAEIIVIIIYRAIQANLISSGVLTEINRMR